MSTEEKVPTRLFLNFDVNKTIIFIDPAGGKSVEDMVNSSLSSYTFGKLTDDQITFTTSVTKEDCEKFLEQIFKQVDHHKDGVLTKSEVEEALLSMDFPLKTEDVSQVIQSCDKNRDGKLDKKEFTEGILNLAVLVEKPKNEKPSLKWEIVSKEPTLIAPEKGLVSFADFIEIYAFPDPKHGDDVSPSERNRINKEQKKLRDQAKGNFTKKGNPGEKFGDWADKFLKKLESKKPTENQKYVFLLPCFFNLFIELEKKKYEYTMIIRTFGTDIKEIQEEFNEFCDGKHHDYPNVLFNGTNGTKDLRVSKLSFKHS